MLPTVELADHVVVNKLAYGVRLPLASWYLARFGGPERGDVVVLDAPDTGIVLLKRVVGLPGDRVEVRGKQVVVNDQPVPRGARALCPRDAREEPARPRPR